MKGQICILGLGYIGLPTAAVLASSGYNVIGVDKNKDIIDNLNKGKITIEEPYLKEIIEVMVKEKKILGKYEPCESDVFIICVPTPIKSNKTADLSYVISATNSILPYIKKGDTIVLESTSPVGTTKNIAKLILEKSGLEAGKDLYLGYCPERVIPGKIIEELHDNDRVIGGINEISALNIKAIYKSFVKGTLYITDTDTAEMVKLTENSFRDVNIAFANELLKICDGVGINVWELINYCNKHPRVNILNPGPGVGGHCLAVDPWFIVEKSKGLSNIIKTSRETNDCMPMYIFNEIERLTKDIKESKKVAILGITYKKDTDDMRESPILHLVEILEDNSYQVSLYDPYVKDCKNLERDLLECAKDSHLLLLGVDHSIFKSINYKEIYEVMKGDFILDTRNYINKEEINNTGFKYKLIGNKNIYNC